MVNCNICGCRVFNMEGISMSNDIGVLVQRAHDNNGCTIDISVGENGEFWVALCSRGRAGTWVLASAKELTNAVSNAILQMKDHKPLPLTVSPVLLNASVVALPSGGQRTKVD